MALTALERILERAIEQHGFVRAADATELGVDPTNLRKWVATGRAQRRAWGLYRLGAVPPGPHDEYHEAVLWAGGRGVIGGEAALALWDLADVNPRHIEIIVPPDYNPRRRGPDRFRPVRRRLAAEDVDVVDNIPVLSARAAIADAIEAGVAASLVDQAIATARARGLIGALGEARLRVHVADRVQAVDERRRCR